MSQASQEEAPLSRDELYETLQNLKGSDLEYFLAELWAWNGWETDVTSSSQDRGIDVIATQSSPLPLRILIQAKGYGSSSTVSSTEVQQYSSLKQQDDEADIVVIVTTGDFSDPAQKIGESLDIKLIDISSLVDTVAEVDAYELLNPYVDKDLSPDSDNKKTDRILSEEPVIDPDLDLEAHLFQGKRMQSLVPAEEYQTEEATLLVHSSNRSPRFASDGPLERFDVDSWEDSDTPPTYLHLTTKGIHLLVRASDDDKHVFLPYESVSSARVETTLFGPVETINIGTIDGTKVEYEYENMETEQERRLRTTFKEKVGIDPLD
jgi:restriction system protein